MNPFQVQGLRRGDVIDYNFPGSGRVVFVIVSAASRGDGTWHVEWISAPKGKLHSTITFGDAPFVLEDAATFVLRGAEGTAA